MQPTAAQVQHRDDARATPAFFAHQNQGRPPLARTLSWRGPSVASVDRSPIRNAQSTHPTVLIGVMLALVAQSDSGISRHRMQWLHAELHAARDSSEYGKWLRAVLPELPVR